MNDANKTRTELNHLIKIGQETGCAIVVSLLAADPECPRLAVAESPIDALSLASLVKLSGGEWRDSHYLSLGGTAPRAMLQFLHDHPHVTQVSLCLDNDKAGMLGMERLEQAIRLFVKRNFSRDGKNQAGKAPWTVKSRFRG